MPAKLRVTLRKSPISYTARARGTVRALGLHRIGDSHVLPDDPAVRGQLRAVRFLVEVEELPDEEARTSKVSRPSDKETHHEAS
jgi:large subunit ribosomal protein L30